MRRAVVLFNLGGPQSSEEVVPFLKSLFSDPAIISCPSWMRGWLVRMIVAKRKVKAEEIYQKLGGKSPLLENTVAQARALEKVLGEGYKVFVAMRHASPFASEVVEKVKEYKPHETILLPLYPQLSTTTTASFFREWERERRLRGLICTQYRICCYPQLTELVDTIARLTIEEMRKFPKPPLLVFSAHGIPLRILKKGDPYISQVERTFKAVLRKLREVMGEAPSAVLCYQSRLNFGRLNLNAWSEPFLDTVIEKAGHDKDSVLVVPISFTSEHAETLVELDIDYRQKALDLGVPHYGRVPTVGVAPLFIEGLAKLVRSKEGARGSCAIGWGQCWQRKGLGTLL